MRLLRVDSKANKVSEIKTFEPLNSKYTAIQTAVEQGEEDGTYLLDEGDGSYYEFSVKDGAPHFLPGNEGLHEGDPERHMARIQRAPDSLRETKEKYGDFHLDSPGAAPTDNPFAPQPVAEEPTEEVAASEEVPAEVTEEVPAEVTEEVPAEETAEATEEVPAEETAETLDAETLVEGEAEGSEAAPEDDEAEDDEAKTDFEDIPADAGGDATAE